MSNAVPSSQLYGHSSGLPPTSSLYAPLASANGPERTVDLDITASTLPTYAAMRRLYREAGLHDGELATNYLEAMARKDFLQYRIEAFSAR
jgi:hypothetical protein